MSETGGGGQSSGRRRRPLRWHEQEFSITSLTDIMTCIVVFLIMNYQCSELTIMPPAGLQLPSSISQEHPKQAVMVAYSPNEIIVDGERVAELNQGYPANTDREGLIIRPLLEKLKKNADNSMMIAKYNSGFKFEGKMIFQGYNDLPFEFLNSVLYTATLAGYFDFQFVTIHTDKLAAVAKSGSPSPAGPDSSPPPSSPEPPPPLPRS